MKWKIFFIWFKYISLLGYIISQNCQSELDYYKNAFKELEKERDNLKTRLDEHTMIISKLSDYMNRIKKEEYTLHPIEWANKVTSATYSLIRGMLKTITVKSNAKLIITLHSHCVSPATDNAVDIAIFLNGVVTGINTENRDDPNAHVQGMSISHTTSFTPCISMARKNVSPGDYTIEVKSKLRYASTGYVSGPIALIEVLYD